MAAATNRPETGRRVGVAQASELPTTTMSAVTVTGSGISDSFNC